MDMTGEYRIPAPREQVWAALNDPEILKASLPGCESLERVSDHEFAATVAAKVGPVRAKFNGQVTLSDLHPPESYKISGEGKGGAAGFAKGGADVRLVEEAAAVTVLTYTAKADVGGKLAQLGSRLIDATAKKMADEFFENFRRQLTGPEAEAAAAPALAPEAEATVASRAAAAPDGLAGLAQNKFVWAAAAIVLLMILVLLFR
jgi:carbon monoxide dehydrogenase subunit G